MMRLATPADDAALRRLLRDNPIPGPITLSYEREPNYFIASGVDGPLSQTLVSLDDATGQILGMGTRVVRPLFLNGAVQDVGYMSHLRVNLRYPWGMALARHLGRAFEAFHELHADGRVPFYLMSIIDTNETARRLLTANISGMPQARPYARMYTYAISPRRLQPDVPLPKGVTLERGTPQHTAALLEHLQCCGAQHQFCPVWSAETLFNPVYTPNLHPGDFFLAIQGSQVIGCLALWDQTPFKQMVVRGYTGSLARWRWAINRLARVINIPYLPEVDAPLPYAYASHLAVEGHQPQIFNALLRAVYNESARRGFNYFMLGLSETNPLRASLTRSYLHITYPSQLYLMAWEDGLATVEQIDGRIPGPEVAVL